MTPLYLFRLILDSLALCLLTIALAYDWLGNTAHEIIGVALFGLLVAHIVFNRRWFSGLKRIRWEPRWLLTCGVNLAFLATMLALLVTSMIISQVVFGFLNLTSTFNARQIHGLVGYLALLIVGFHIGLQWSLVMTVVRNRLRLSPPQRFRTGVLRVLAIGIASYGVYSLAVVNMDAKLTMTMTMDFWDFETKVLSFFVHISAIVGLGTAVGHYAQLLSHRKSR